MIFLAISSMGGSGSGRSGWPISSALRTSSCAQRRQQDLIAARLDRETSQIVWRVRDSSRRCGLPSFVAAHEETSAQTPLSSSAASTALLIASDRSLQPTARSKRAARVIRKLLPARQALREWASAYNSRRRRRRWICLAVRRRLEVLPRRRLGMRLLCSQSGGANVGKATHGASARDLLANVAIRRVGHADLDHGEVALVHLARDIAGIALDQACERRIIDRDGPLPNA